MTTPLRVDEENSQAWTAVAHSARVHHRAMSLIRDPQPGSNFADVAELYPYEKVSDRVRAYLMAGIEHMLMWADFTAPLKFHEEQVTNVMLRPAYTLARATIEASAQAVWLMDTRDPVECVRRHLSLMRWDLQGHRKSKLDQSEKDVIKAREDALMHRASQVFQPDDIKPPNGYIDVIKLACTANGLDLEAAVAEGLWRAASGAAHGNYWPTLELQHIQVGEEYEPGHHRTMELPDASAMTEVLEAANTMSQYGVVLYARYSGVDVAAVLGEAMAWVAELVPLKPGATRADLMNLQHSLPWPENNGEARPHGPEKGDGLDHSGLSGPHSSRAGTVTHSSLTTRMMTDPKDPQLAGGWVNEGTLETAVDYTCGWCDRLVATNRGWKFSRNVASGGDPELKLLICPNCRLPSYTDEESFTPGVAPGSAVLHCPERVTTAYEEARLCLASGASTAGALLLRKLLMYIAVEEGAEAGRNFTSYVDYLAQKGFIPPKGQPWVDHLRTKGNEATHELAFTPHDEASLLLTFAEMLLKFIYEFPQRLPQEGGSSLPSEA